MSADISDAQTEVAVDSAELAEMVETNPELNEMPELYAAGTVIADRYRIVRHLGSGGMGNVYLAEHTAIGKQVAIKTLNLEYARRRNLRERFLREARSASQIRHPNVVDITDFGSTHEGAPFIAMEYLEGEDLQATLDREGRLPFERARALTVQICRALQAAHDKGIIHRDVKPANCFRIEHAGVGDVIKMVDFGIAKTMVGTTEGTELTKTGVIVGTAAYMSPEQARGDADLDARADVYSVGVILFRMLSGSMPYFSKSPLGMITKHLTEPVPSLLEVAPEAGLSRRIDEIVGKALAKDRDDRWQSAAELAEALEQVDARAADAAGRRRGKLGWQLAGVALIVAVVAGGAALWNSSSEGEQPSTPPSPPAIEDVATAPPEPNELVPAPDPAEDGKVTVTLIGAPDDAWVEVEGVNLGPASQPFTLPKSADTISIEVSAPGFVSSTVAVVPIADLEVPVGLAPAPEQPELPVAESESESESGKSGGKKKPDEPTTPEPPEPPPEPSALDKEMGY